jgi:PhnB protein
MPVKPIPDGYHSVTPYLLIRGAAAAIEFYKKALGAKEILRLPGPDGKVAHAEIQLGDSIVMLGDEMPGMPRSSPQKYGGTPVGIHLYVEDADAVFERSVALGAKVDRPMVDQFYGDRSGTIEDPFGHIWTISTHKEDLTEEQIQQRLAAMKK